MPPGYKVRVTISWTSFVSCDCRALQATDSSETSSSPITPTITPGKGITDLFMTMLAIWVLWSMDTWDFSVFSVRNRHGDEGLTAELFLLVILFWVERLTRGLIQHLVCLNKCQQQFWYTCLHLFSFWIAFNYTAVMCLWDVSWKQAQILLNQRIFISSCIVRS